MSLVSEALRKARREAEEQGRPVESRPRFFFSGAGRVDSRLGTGLVLGAIITFAAAMAGGLVAWWVIGGRQVAEPVLQVASTSPSPAAQPATVAESVGTEIAASIGPAEEADDDQPIPTDVDEPAAIQEAEAQGEMPATPEREVADSEASVAAPSHDPPAPTINADGSREFVAVATIGDVSLTLGYLLYRPTDPFVQINGIDMRVGAMIEGFVIDEITRDRVVLHDDEGPVVIRVR